MDWSTSPRLGHSTVYSFLGFFLIAVLHLDANGALLFRTAAQLDCVDTVVKNGQIIFSDELDVDGDGAFERVLLYSGQGLQIRLVKLVPPDTCEILLDDRITAVELTEGRRRVEVHTIEPKDLSGDGEPELYVWISKIGGGRFSSAQVHAIYSAVNGSWKELLHLEQCLHFSSLEFRDSTTSSAKDVYRDMDIVCDSPFSSHRRYDLFKWNGSEFALTESGEIRKWSVTPPLAYLCAGTGVGVILLAAISALVWRSRRSRGNWPGEKSLA